MAASTRAESDERSVSLFPASDEQARILLQSSLGFDLPPQHIPAAVRVRGRFAAEQLQRALDRLVERHETLRTSFALEDGAFVQRVEDTGRCAVRICDLRDVPAAERDGAMRERMRREVREPFDLERGPLLRCCVYLLGPEEHGILLTLHHAIADGWSLRVLIQEMSQLLPDGGAELPALDVQFGDVVEWQRERLAEIGGRLEADWRRRLAGAPTRLPLPTSHPRPARRRLEGARACRALPETLGAGLAGFARDARVSSFSVWLAVFAAFLHRISGCRDLCIASPFANRDRPELQPLIAMLVNVAPIRVRLEEGASFRELARAAHAASLEARRGALLPLERVLQAVGARADAAAVPFAQVAIHVDYDAIDSFRVGGLEFEAIELDLEIARTDLLLLIRSSASQPQLVLEYDARLYEPSVAEAWTDELLEIAASLLERADLPVVEAAPAVDAGRWGVRDFSSDPADAAPRRRGGAPPATRTERVLATVFQGVLEVPDLGRHDDFFELGGDSMLAVRIAVEARRHGLSFEARDVIEHPTLAELAPRAAQVAAAPPPAPETRERGEVRRGAASPVQREMWNAQARDPARYLSQRCVEIDEALDVGALGCALATLVRCHESLRTGFAPGADGLERLVLPWNEVRPKLVAEDWRDRDAGQQVADMAALFARERDAGFDLTRPPLLRVTALRVGDMRWRLAVTCHHLIVDGWSSAVLRGELARLHRDHRQGRPPSVRDAPGYSRFVDWLAGQKPAVAFWRDERLGDFAGTMDTGLPRARGARGCRRSRTLDASASRGLRDFARAGRLTLATLVHAAWGLALCERTGCRDVVFSGIRAGRPAELDGAERIVGPFVTVVPERVRVPDGGGVLEWLARLQRAWLDSERRQHVPPGTLRRILEARCGQDQPESALAFQNWAGAWVGRSDGWRPIPVAGGGSGFRVLAECVPGAEIELSLDVDATVRARDADALLGRWSALLEALPRQTDRPGWAAIRPRATAPPATRVIHV